MHVHVQFRVATITVLVSSALLTTAALAHEGQHDPDKAPAAPAVAAPAHAAGDHHHEPPHGGVAATVDKETHVEVVFGDKAIAVYFYDADMKPVALPADAKATVVVGKVVKKLDLPIGKKPDGAPDDHLVGDLSLAADQKVAVVIQATVLGKARTARVERAAVKSPAAPAPAAPAPPQGTK